MFIKKLDQLGRIVVPKDLRRKLNIELGDDLELSLSGDTIEVKKYTDGTNANSNLNELKTVIEKQDNKELKAELLGVLSTHTTM